MHRREEDSLIDLHRGLVEESIKRLQSLQPSVVANRGTHILSVLLAEAKHAPRPTNTTRKRRLPEDRELVDRQRHAKIMKLAGRPSADSSATIVELDDSVQAQDIDPSVQGAHNPVEELETMNIRVPEMLPPQAGFSNDFLFNELLDLWV